MKARSWARWLALASSAALLCGCASVSERTAPAPLARALPDTCERILKRDPLPAIKPTDDAGAAFLKDDRALIIAGDRIDAGRGCVTDMRKRYSGEKP